MGPPPRAWPCPATTCLRRPFYPTKLASTDGRGRLGAVLAAAMAGLGCDALPGCNATEAGSAQQRAAARVVPLPHFPPEGTIMTHRKCHPKFLESKIYETRS